MRAYVLALLCLSTLVLHAHAQWELHDGHTTADLRGIDNVGNGVAWASGTDGTILRTDDAGIVWQLCAKPPGGEHLDFRAVQAFDNNTAIIMSSGKGDLSRLYKTTDGCQTWKLIFTNPDKDGFWDGLVLNRFAEDGMLVGDPVAGRFSVWDTGDKGGTWAREVIPGLEARPNEGVFAASNSSLSDNEATVVRFGTGGKLGGRVFISDNTSSTGSWRAAATPIRHDSDSSGIFSMNFRTYDGKDREIDDDRWVAVGGDYMKPEETSGSAIYTLDSGKHWHSALTPPHGFRSAVAYDEKTKTWITVGPNGTDISTDDGRNWRALHPNPKYNDTPDADQHWNALSLPYAVGPHGRIGKLRGNALKP